MFLPMWLILLAALLFVGLAIWTALLVTGRNPLPFPDVGSRIFAASSPEAKAAIVALLKQDGIRERFRSDSSDILRSIMWDGTIINYSRPEVVQKLDSATSGIGLVSSNPEASANRAAEFLRSRGFSARVVTDVDPGLPIAYVVTNAMPGTIINYRKHVIHLPRPQPVPSDAN
ncbi:hypothetical protein [Gemmatimonas aurantiaca]|uniref:hypothetical protein n=1 Tax=Gemmatimonas aurantiaca TaxID=173480 RepID=UPI00301DE1CA